MEPASEQDWEEFHAALRKLLRKTTPDSGRIQTDEEWELRKAEIKRQAQVLLDAEL